MTIRVCTKGCSSGLARRKAINAKMQSWLSSCTRPNITRWLGWRRLRHVRARLHRVFGRPADRSVTRSMTFQGSRGECIWIGRGRGGYWWSRRERGEQRTRMKAGAYGPEARAPAVLRLPATVSLHARPTSSATYRITEKKYLDERTVPLSGGIDVPRTYTPDVV